MNTYKLALQQKLRIQTARGPLSAEQLFELSIEELDALAVELEEKYRESSKKSFVQKSAGKDKTAKLKFDLVLDILNGKVEEMEAAQEAAEIKEHNEKIIELISDKENDELKGKSIAQLKKMLK